MGRYLARRFTEDHAGLERQLLVRSHRRIVARHNAAWRKQLDQGLDDPILRRVHPLIQRLDHQIVAVPVDNQGRQPVTLAMDHAIGIGVAHDTLTVLIRFRQAPREK